jgi:hypothetical protein
MAGRALFRGSVRGARAKGRKFSSGGRQIQQMILDEFAGRLAPDATELTRAFAPHRSGQLERALKARVRSYGGRVVIEVLADPDPVSDEGFHYLRVTRFGHRMAIIYPKRAKALRFYLGGHVVYRAWVRGYKPDHDWVDFAFRAVEQEFNEAEKRLGRTIDRRLLR